MSMLWAGAPVLCSQISMFSSRFGSSVLKRFYWDVFWEVSAESCAFFEDPVIAISRVMLLNGAEARRGEETWPSFKRCGTPINRSTQAWRTRAPASAFPRFRPASRLSAVLEMRKIICVWRKVCSIFCPCD